MLAAYPKDKDDPDYGDGLRTGDYAGGARTSTTLAGPPGDTPDLGPLPAAPPISVRMISLGTLNERVRHAQGQHRWACSRRCVVREVR
jgi:hypothetical protein